MKFLLPSKVNNSPPKMRGRPYYYVKVYNLDRTLCLKVSLQVSVGLDANMPDFRDSTLSNTHKACPHPFD